MVDDAVDHAILAVSIVAALLGVTMLASGEVAALAALAVGAAGFAYLKADLEQVRQLVSSGEREVDQAEDALTVLRGRYARGEIDQDEFERRLDDLLETETVEQAETHRETERTRERE